MRPLLAVVCVFLPGCSNPGTGGHRDGLPLATVSYRERDTYPIVLRAVMDHISADAMAVHALEFMVPDISLEEAVASELTAVSVKFIPRSQVSVEDGQFVDAKSSDPVLVWSVKPNGGQSDWLRFRVDRRRGERDSDSYEVILRGSEQTIGWRVDPQTPRKL